MKGSFLLFIFLITFGKSWCQNDKDSVVIHIKPMWNKEAFFLDSTYVSTTKDIIKITALKFYISNLTSTTEDKNATRDRAFLIDFEDKNSLSIFTKKQKNTSLKKIEFHIGVDSIASVSGALSGDLDPSKGMYWAWQSGYINLKIEGSSPSCNTRKNEFQFHVGGYQKPFYALQTISLKVNNSKEFTIVVDVAKFFENIALRETNSVLIPGNKAIELAKKSATMFYLE